MCVVGWKDLLTNESAQRAPVDTELAAAINDRASTTAEKSSDSLHEGPGRAATLTGAALSRDRTRVTALVSFLRRRIHSATAYSSLTPPRAIVECSTDTTCVAIAATLPATNGNKVAAATALDIGRTPLRRCHRQGGVVLHGREGQRGQSVRGLGSRRILGTIRTPKPGGLERGRIRLGSCSEKTSSHDRGRTAATSEGFVHSDRRSSRK